MDSRLVYAVALVIGCWVLAANGLKLNDTHSSGALNVSLALRSFLLLLPASQENMCPCMASLMLFDFLCKKQVSMRVMKFTEMNVTDRTPSTETAVVAGRFAWRLQKAVTQ